MYYSTSPLNGPSSSDSFNNDILDIENSLQELISQINSSDPVIFIDESGVTSPALNTGLNISLPALIKSSGGKIGRVGATTLNLAPYNDNYISISSDGSNTVPRYFPSDNFVLQSNGNYAGYYLLQKNPAIAKTSVNITGGATFWQSYTCIVVDRIVSAHASGWGPAIMDKAGNGYFCRFYTSGAAIFEQTPTGITQIVQFNNPSVFAGSICNLLMGVQQQESGSFLITIRANSTNQNLFQYMIQNPTLDPTQIYPAFYSDTGYVFFPTNQSYWYNDDNSPVLSWFNTWGQNLILGRRYFQIRTTNVPIKVTNIFDHNTLATKIAGARSRINLITGAYF